MESVTCKPPQVEVFTLSSGAWRRSYGNLPRESIHFLPGAKVFVDGVFYWLASDGFAMDRHFKLVIISFDMTSEELTEVTLPDSLEFVSLSKLGESLVVVGQDEHSGYDLWMMRGGVPKSFTKLFSFKPNDDAIVMGFQKSGELIIDVPEEGEGDRGQLAIYEPNSKRINNLGIVGFHGSFVVFNYMETLLLLDQPDLMVYDGI
ncbi:F-box/kelch-repeat protein At3g06240-like [Bidens hawaiensis]|uniref:F-box/kelch-repeat protein At3g06240-like n=1 Tax=Bidens hawaiensis TaxID=980011 RepID=UPI004049623F